MENVKFVSVVFDFDFESLEERVGATRYTYFVTEEIPEGSLVAVLSPHGKVSGALVVDSSPGAAAISRATKSIIGTVSMGNYVAAKEARASRAKEEALARYVPGLV